jgi:hypothetical protein
MLCASSKEQCQVKGMKVLPAISCSFSANTLLNSPVSSGKLPTCVPNPDAGVGDDGVCLGGNQQPPTVILHVERRGNDGWKQPGRHK